MRRVRFIFLVTGAMIAALAAGCQPAPEPPNGSGADVVPVDSRAIVCDKARAALDAVRVEGASQHVYALVEDFLDAADDSGDTILLYQAAQVGDAHRGTDPELTLEPALANTVMTCAQGS